MSNLQDRQQQLQDLRENRLKSYISMPGDIVEHCRAEYRVAGDTAGRPLIELLQNADDAIHLDLNAKRKAVRIVLSEDYLFITNDGAPFSPEGVEAICNLDRSPKRDRRITIGNKGIGFKSILAWTKEPSIYSTTFQFFFDREKSAKEISEKVGIHFDRTYSPKEVPLMRLPFWVPDSNPEIGKLMDEGYVTTIVLKLKSNEVYKDINLELQEFDDLSLLFLHALSCLEIITSKEKKRFIVDRQRENIHIDKNGEKESYRHFSRDLDIPNNVKESLSEDNQDLTNCRITIAIPETPLKEHPKLFVYFPTAERAPFKYLINGDFVLDASRKHLADSAKVYHEWMASKLADLFCEESLPYLIEKYDREIISFISCRDYNDMEDNEKLIFNAFKEKLSQIKFLPVMGNPEKLVTPQEAALVGSEIAKDLMKLFDNEIEYKGRLIVHPDWSSGQRLETLERLGAKRLQKKDLIEIISQNNQPDPSWCGKALQIILKWIENTSTYNNQGGETQGILLFALSGQKLFLTDKKQFRPLVGKDLPPLFLSSSNKVLEVPSFIKLNFLHPDLSKDLEAAEQKLFLKNLDLLYGKGLHKFNPLEVVKQAVLPFIENPDNKEISDADKISLLRFLADLKLNEKKFDETEPYSCFDEMRYKLAKLINVPIRRGGWYPAWKVYAGQDWGAMAALEYLYKDQPDRAILVAIDDPIHQNIDVDTWKQLYRFIGVSWEPKILPFENHPASISRRNFPNPHSLQISNSEWEKYHDYLAGEPKLSDMWKWYDIYLEESYVLDGWDSIRQYVPEFMELAYTTGLYDYLVGDKKAKIDTKFKYKKVTWNYYPSCESFIHWTIKNIPWLNVSDQFSHVPSEVFLANSEIGQDVGGILAVIDLPAPNEKILFRRWEDLLDEIGIRRKWQQVKLSDWKQWLSRIPDMFPSINQENSGLIKELYLQCLKRCQTGGEEKIFSNIKVLAIKGLDSYQYEEANRVIYFDDPRFDGVKSKLYSKEFLIFPIELGGIERQKKAKLLFGMKPISDIVSEKLKEGSEDQQKTDYWQSQINKITPLLLARLSKDRPESRDRDKELLQSIKLKALNGLRRQFYVKESDVFLLEEIANACWSDNGDSNILFLNMEESKKNPWSYIAEALAQRFGRTYYEAFKVILTCTSDEERIEELRRAGVSEDDIRSCEDNIKNKITSSNEKVSHINAGKLINNQNEVKEDEDAAPIGDQGKEILSVENAEIGPPMEIIINKPQEVTSPRTSPSMTSGVTSQVQEAIIKEEIEKEAMKWAMHFENEHGRIPSDVSLLNRGYDIESKDAETGEVRYIEVKGASGNPEKREITINEWQTAIKLGDDYYIYYVLGLKTKEGEIRIVKNPHSKLTIEEKTFNISIPGSSADEVFPLVKKND